MPSPTRRCNCIDCIDLAEQRRILVAVSEAYEWDISVTPDAAETAQRSEKLCEAIAAMRAEWGIVVEREGGEGEASDDE